MFVKSLCVAVTIFGFCAETHAATTQLAIDFTKYDMRVAITDQIPGVIFSLVGGASNGPPTTAQQLEGTSSLGLTNSSYFGIYPTATILNLSFSGLASNISFYFQPNGFEPSGAGATYYQAFSSTGTLLETGKLGEVSDGAAADFTVLAKNVAKLQFNTGGMDGEDWVFSLRTFNATLTPLAPVPEPETYAMLLAGLGAMAGLVKGKSRRSAVT